MATRSSPVIQPISARNLFRQVWSSSLICATATSFLSVYEKGPEIITITIAYAATTRCHSLLASLHQIRLECMYVIYMYLLKSCLSFWFSLFWNETNVKKPYEDIFTPNQNENQNSLKHFFCSRMSSFLLN